MKEKLGKSLLTVKFLCAEENFNFHSKPFLSSLHTKNSIAFAVTDFNTMSGFFVSYRFSRPVKYRRAWYGAAKIVARRIAKILKSSGMYTVVFSSIGSQEVSEEIKAGILQIRKLGILVI